MSISPATSADLNTIARLLDVQNQLLRVLVLLTLGNQKRVSPDLIGLVANDLVTLLSQYGT